MVNLKINGIAVSVPEGSTILQAAKVANVRIPTLCYLKDVQCVGSCRMCLVEATGARGLVAACIPFPREWRSRPTPRASDIRAKPRWS
jgi:NADH-quinone oxidoreductase subunit G/NADP-reducing hydrogenase subunit HndD